jgi:type VI secretion system FHA domain protein
MAKALVLTLEGTGESRELAGGALSVGRGQDNDWVLVDPGPTPTVSRRHCRFAVGPEGATVTDLGSTNGTRVDGRPLAPRTPADLRGGEVIEVGARRVLVEFAEPWARGGPGLPAMEPLGAHDPFAGSGPPPPRWGRDGEDPLAGAFSEDLPPLGRGRGPAPAPERQDVAGPPQLEALLPRRATPLAADPLASDPLAGPRPSARGSEPPVPRPGTGASRHDDDDDPFGLGPLEARQSPPAQRPPPPEAAAVEPPRARGGTAGSPRTAPAGASGAAALAAFLEGAGVDASAAGDQSPEAFLRETGQVFARLANGVRELLAVRAAVKDQAGLDRTQISAASNNPLKLSVNGCEATAALLGRGEEGYLAPIAAVDASFRDLKAHEFAVLEGVRSAVEELLELFDPAALEQRLDEAGMLATLIQGGRRARLWEHYQERYGEIAEAARTRFMGRLDDAFRSAYARKAAEVSALDADPSAPRPGGRRP